jgi:hypothetical protein
MGGNTRRTRRGAGFSDLKQHDGGETYSVQPAGVVHSGIGCYHVVAAATEYVGGLRLPTYASLSLLNVFTSAGPGCATVATVGFSYEKSISVNSLSYSGGQLVVGNDELQPPGLDRYLCHEPSIHLSRDDRI